MPTFGSIDFDNAILNALRDDKLVVFAGAGISEGAPSNLPLFDELADAIGKDVGQDRDDDEPVDRFLGRLAINVHERAKELLTPDGSKPHPLHYDLLKLFADSAKIRIVTTNFDLHFETAARDLIQQKFFQTLPEIYRAPALPLGNRFNGVVHVHGALPTAADLVLTDADFGRAYLLEGWARRFLVEMFREYTVLFVGYSHSDTVMHYLARSLPVAQGKTRFALTPNPDKWDSLGITPIIYNNETGNHQALCDGIRKFAESASRGAMNWRTWLAQHCAGEPPLLDEEIAAQVDMALQEEYTTRLFTNNARHPGWLKWLADRGHLSAIFGQEDLSDKERMLANWLAWNYAIEHADTLFTLVVENKLCLNPYLWNQISFRLGRDGAEILDSSAMRRWVMAYLSFAPKTQNNLYQHVMTSLAGQCAKWDMIDLVLNIFLHAGEYHCKVGPRLGFSIIDEETPGVSVSLDWSTHADYGGMRDIWIKLLEPKLGSIAQPLISGIYSQIDRYYRTATTWGDSIYSYEISGQHRLAIEDHEQNGFRKVIDVLIDAMRDALTWLLSNAPAKADAWIEQMMNSDAILLQRIAIHAMGEHPGKSADKRLEWLVARAPLFSEDFSNGAHHEVYQAAKKSYPQASPTTRKSLVNAILAYHFPANESRSAEKAAESTAWRHYKWLEWLSRTDADCPLLQKHLSLITTKYPKWEPSEHPDFLYSRGKMEIRRAGSTSGVAKLLSRPASKQIDELLNFKGDSKGDQFRDPDREDVLTDIREACEKDLSWGIGLVEGLAARHSWKTDLWERAFTGLRKANLKQDDWTVLLQVIATPELQTEQPREIAFLLETLVKDGGKPYTMDLLEIANHVALAIWDINVDDDDSRWENPDWLGRAINEPAGMIILFWIEGLSLLLRGKSGGERKIPEHYREWFNMAIKDDSPKGGMARCLLASQVSFFWGLDEEWTRERIIPLFSNSDSAQFLQAWHGFITWGRLMPGLVDALKPGFLTALERLDEFDNNHREKFFRIFAWLLTIYEDAPDKELIPAMNKHSDESDRKIFAGNIRSILQELPSDSKQELWKRWLFEYWRSRWGFCAPSEPMLDEGGTMLEWLPHLGDAFPEAVSVIEKSSFNIGRFYMSSDLDKSGLIKQYPNDAARLLIHLCHKAMPDGWYSISEIVRLLPPISDEDLKRKLNECLITIGLEPLD